MSSKYYYWRKKGKEALEKGDYKRAESFFLRSYAAAKADNREFQEATAIVNIVACQVELGVDNSPEMELARAYLHNAPHPRIAYLASYHFARFYEKKGDPRKALFYANLAVQKAQECQEKEYLGATYMLMGNMLVAMSRFPQAEFYYKKALDELPCQSPHLLSAILLDNLGYCQMMQDHIEDGIRTCERGLAMLPPENHDSPYATYFFMDLCYGYLEWGDAETAYKQGKRGLALARHHEQKKLERNTLLLLGECALALSRWDEAQSYFGQVASFYPEVKMGMEVMMGVRLTRMVNLRA